MENPPKPLDVPPFQIRGIINSVKESFGSALGSADVQVRSAQALGSEVYVGCSNGELLRYALQADNPQEIAGHSLLSRQSLPGGKPIDEIVLIPCISRVFVLTDHQIHFFSLPALDPVPNLTKPIRNVVAFAVDHQHLQRPAPSYSEARSHPEAVEFCVIKRTSIAMFSLRETLYYQKDIPFPQDVTLARRTGKYLCIAHKENAYNMIDLEIASLIELLPISQAFDNLTPIKPFIEVVNANEFLLLSWLGNSTLGVYITGEGEAVRGTLEWPSHPQAICLDYPHVTALLQDGAIHIHSIETQSIKQVIPPPTVPTDASQMHIRSDLAVTLGGYMVPSLQRAERMRPKPVPLIRASNTKLSSSNQGEQHHDEIGIPAAYI